MYRITNKRVPLWLAASVLLIPAVALATPAHAQPQIDAAAFCAAFPPPAFPPFGFDEVIVGTPDTDSLKGGSGNDLIYGLAGNDEISGGGGDDIVCGNEGDDALKGGSGTNHLVGGVGTDQMKGGSGTDYFYRDAADRASKGGGGSNFACPTGFVDVCK